jgi:hypothetical protein
MKLNKQRLNSKGFSHIEMILAVVVVVAIAGVGVFVYKHHQNSSKSMESMNSTNKLGSLTQKPLVSSTPVKGSSVMVNGKSLGSLVPKASALNLSHIAAAPAGTYNASDWNIYACRTYVNAFGGVYEIQAYYWASPNYPSVAYLYEWTPTSGLNPAIIDQQRTAGISPNGSYNGYGYFYRVVAELSMNVSAQNPNHIIEFLQIPNNYNVPSVSPTIANAFTVTNIGKDIVSC